MTNFEKVVEIMQENRNVDPSLVKPETTFAELGLDSLDMVELVMAMEEKHGCALEMTADIKTVGDVAQLLGA